MRLSTVKNDIAKLDSDRKYLHEFNYISYKRKVKVIFKEYGLSLMGSGAYSDIYSSKDFNYVVKLIKHPGSGKYSKSYSAFYLKPCYISKNHCLAIQKKVPILKDIVDSLYDKYEDAKDDNIGLANGKLLIIDLDRQFEVH